MPCSHCLIWTELNLTWPAVQFRLQMRWNEMRWVMRTPAVSQWGRRHRPNRSKRLTTSIKVLLTDFMAEVVPTVIKFQFVIGRVSYIRISLCYFCFRWKTISLVQASMQHLMHHVTVSLQQSKITLQNNCINNSAHFVLLFVTKNVEFATFTQTDMIRTVCSTPEVH